MNSLNPLHRALRWIAASRPGFLSVTLVAALVGIASAHACGTPWKWPEAVATVVLALLAHAAINLHNDWGDALLGSDALNTDRISPFTGGSRVVQDGIFTPDELRDMVHMLGIVVVGGGLLLMARSGIGLALVGLAGLALGWTYSNPRWGLMKLGLGELAVAMGWALVVVGADYVQRGAFSGIAAIAGVSMGLMVAGVLWVNEFPDARSDALVGKRTLVVRWGRGPAAWGYVALVLLAHAWVAYWWHALWLPTQAWWALCSLPLSLSAAWGVVRHVQEPQRLRPAIVLTVAAVVAHGLLLTASFAAVAWMR
jgi:1,4-dihydroxy-2-naphthoate octaprenyltransferase